MELEDDEDVKIFDINEFRKAQHDKMDARIANPTDFRGPVQSNDIIPELIDVTVPENIEINVANCALLSGKTLEVEGTRAIGEDLQATTSIGNTRENQEDAFLLMEHPVIPGFKIMAVSDGMGGVNNGEIASHITLDSIRKLFLTLTNDDYENPEKVQEKLIRLINLVSKLLNELYEGAGCTLSCAICGKDRTLITNIGDSRIYRYKDGDLEKMTVDQSLAAIKVGSRRN